jgi:hypothetical protein
MGASPATLPVLASRAHDDVLSVSSFALHLTRVKDHRYFSTSCSELVYLTSPVLAMGMTYRQYLTGPRIYGCSTCRTHLATISSMISRVRLDKLTWGGPDPSPYAGVQRSARACIPL